MVLNACLGSIRFRQPLMGGRNALAADRHGAGHSIVLVSLEAGTRAEELLTKALLKRRTLDWVKKLIARGIDGGRADEAIGTSSERDVGP